MPRESQGLRLFAPGELKATQSWYLRGTYLGVRVYQSLGPVSATEARELRRALRQRIKRQVLSGDAASGSPKALAGRTRPEPAPTEPTFADAAELYLKTCPDSEVGYVERLLRHFAETPLTEIDQAAIDAAADTLYQGCAPDTKNRNCISPAAAVLHHAANQNLCPWIRVRRRKGNRGRTRYLTPEQAAALLQALPETVGKGAMARHPRAMVLCMLTCRARTNEAIRLEWQTDADVAGGYLTFRDTKNGETYTRAMHPDLREMLANLPLRPHERSRGSKPARRSGKIFGYRDRWQFYGDWRQALSATDIVDFRPHDLGHTFATWLRQQGHDLRMLMDAGGWKDIKSVARYSHVATPEVARAVAGLPVGAEFRRPK